jgi:hypothetical protein
MMSPAGFSGLTVSLVGVFEAMIAGGYVLCLHRHPGLPNFFLLRRCSPTIPLKFLAIGNLLASAPYSMPHPDLLQLFLHFQARIATDRPRMPSGVRLPSEGQPGRRVVTPLIRGDMGPGFAYLRRLRRLFYVGLRLLDATLATAIRAAAGR